MTGSYVLSVGAGSNQIILINEIKKLGYKCASCDLDINAPGRALSDIFLNISTHEPELIINEILKLNIKIEAVLTRSSGIPVLTVAKIAERFDLKGLSSDVAELLIDKSKFIKKMNVFGIPSPSLYDYKPNTENTDVQFPVFVKPSKTNISHAAMNMCNDLDSLNHAYIQASKVSDTNQANVEEYLFGQDLSSIDYVFDGEIIHVLTVGEISSGPPHFDGIGWYSCDKNSNEDYFVLNNFRRIKETLNIKNGFFQSAMKVDAAQGEAKVYEIHAEIGGDLVNDVFIPNITDNYNIFMNNILLSLNKRPQSCYEKIKPAVLLFKEKIKQYRLTFENLLIVSKFESETWVILFFQSYIDLQSYLEIITLQDNFSITNG